MEHLDYSNYDRQLIPYIEFVKNLNNYVFLDQFSNIRYLSSNTFSYCEIHDLEKIIGNLLLIRNKQNGQIT